MKRKNSGSLVKKEDRCANFLNLLSPEYSQWVPREKQKMENREIKENIGRKKEV